MGMSVRSEIFPSDLDATVDFYTRVLRFEIASDRRHEPEPYVAFRRDDVHIGALHDSGEVCRHERRPPVGWRSSSRLTTWKVNWSGYGPWLGHRSGLDGGGVIAEGLGERPWACGASVSSTSGGSTYGSPTARRVCDRTRGVVGFAAAKLVDPDRLLGEVCMLAVDPVAQLQGLGTALTEEATAWLRSLGTLVAMVDTGGDLGHAPARRVYDKAGFTLLPIARYFKAL